MFKWFPGAKGVQPINNISINNNKQIEGPRLDGPSIGLKTSLKSTVVAWSILEVLLLLCTIIMMIGGRYLLGPSLVCSPHVF